MGDGAVAAEVAISVIIPVHKGGANFRRCLVSTAQAWPPL